MANTKPRSRWKPTEEEMRQVDRMSGIGLTQEQIACVLGVSYDTFLMAQKKDDSIRQRVLRAREVGNATVHNTLFTMATSGQCPSATIFWMKVRSRWKEPPQEVQPLDKDGNPSDTKVNTVIVNIPSNGREQTNN
jgi:hypothetical protein